jgi:tRNA U34 2-thiouridine synthase MnmA/TrmU
MSPRLPSLRRTAKLRDFRRAAEGAITPGQAAVFYYDVLVVGGGWIEEVKKEPI